MNPFYERAYHWRRDEAAHLFELWLQVGHHSMARVAWLAGEMDGREAREQMLAQCVLAAGLAPREPGLNFVEV